MTSKQRWKRSFPPAAAQWAKLQPRRSAASVCFKLFTREIPKETLLSFKSGDDGVRSHRARSNNTFLFTPHAKIDSPCLLANPCQIAARLLFRNHPDFVQTI